jgi:hypothetical protein
VGTAQVEAANPASAWRGGTSIDFSTVIAAMHNADFPNYFPFDRFQFALPPDWNAIILSRKVGISPVGARP